MISKRFNYRNKSPIQNNNPKKKLYKLDHPQTLITQFRHNILKNLTANAYKSHHSDSKTSYISTKPITDLTSLTSKLKIPPKMLYIYNIYVHSVRVKPIFNVNSYSRNAFLQLSSERLG